MEQKTLPVEHRRDFKKGASGRLRRLGKIPAIIYGHREPVAVFLDAKEFHRQFHTISENTIIDLKTEDDVYSVLVKDYQEDILKGEILHIDFYEIEQGKTLRTNIPVHVEGTARGVKEGGILDHRLHELEVECLPKDIPEFFRVDVTGLDTGDVIHVSDIPVPQDVKILNSEDQVIVAITHAKIELMEDEGEEAEKELAEGGEAADDEGEESEEEV